MDLEIIILNEVKSDTEKQIPYITYPWNIKKKRYKRTYLQNRNRVTGVENIGDKVRVFNCRFWQTYLIFFFTTVSHGWPMFILPVLYCLIHI